MLRDSVLKALEGKLGYIPAVSIWEWNEAKRQALDDIYVNNLCFFRPVDVDYFTETMAFILGHIKE